MARRQGRPQEQRGLPTLLTGGTAIGDLTGGGGLGAAFNGTTSQLQAACAQKSPSTAGYNNSIGKSWGTPRVLAYVVSWGPSNDNILGTSGGGPTTFHVQGSNDGSSWDTLQSAAAFSNGSGAIGAGYGLPDARYLYHRLLFSGDGSNTLAVAEIAFYGY